MRKAGKRVQSHMAEATGFSLVYALPVREHLRWIEAKHHSHIRESIENQLLIEPTTETRNRKPLRRRSTTAADWELRCGPANQFRVFYSVDEARRQVDILAIGVKERNELRIAGERIQL